MMRVYDNKFKNYRKNPDLIMFQNKSKPMTQNYMYLGSTPIFTFNSTIFSFVSFFKIPPPLNKPNLLFVFLYNLIIRYSHNESGNHSPLYVLIFYLFILAFRPLKLSVLFLFYPIIQHLVLNYLLIFSKQTIQYLFSGLIQHKIICRLLIRYLVFY